MIERRKASRGRVFYGGVIAFNDQRSTIDCTVRNFSPRGAKVEVPFGTVLSSHVGLTVWHRGQIYPARTIWRRGNEAGLAFEMRRDGDNVIDFAERQRLRGGVLRGFVADDTAGVRPGFVLTAGLGGLVAVVSSYGVNTVVAGRFDMVLSALKRY
ncbi:MAG: PilZ domain-containing protein [Pseudomonadota bacterium]|jgi:hypothetical protein